MHSINDIIFSEIELPNLLEENYTYIYLDNIYVYYTNEKKINLLLLN